MAVVIETTLGDLTVDLFLEQRPRTCLNFLKLCKMKYYNFNLFHMIQSGFIAQTGDPTGEGTGGKSVWGAIEDESKNYFEGEKIPKIRHTEPGILSMVTTEGGMIGSQFFLTLAPDLNALDNKHCVIGMVTEGHEVLRLLNEVICDSAYRPYQDVRITHTVVLEDPFEDPKRFREPSRSPSPSAERLAGGRIAPDEEIDEMKGKTEEEIREMIEQREAKARATILEIVGDLPDADMAPPENVLFVCKLNPVTNDDDLEIIFSRFGTIKCCEIIRDKKSGDSLQYAFIEFENKKSCEDAYFKMDNVLIDDRRIHVDFSQSVSKIKWRGKGRGVILVNENDEKDSRHFNKDRSNRNNDGDRRRNENRGDYRKYEKNEDRNRERHRYEKSHQTDRNGREHRDRSPPSKEKNMDESRNKADSKHIQRSHRDRKDERKRSRSNDRKRRSRSNERQRRSRSNERRRRSRSNERKRRSRSNERKRRSRSNERKRRSKSDDRQRRSRSKDKHRSRRSPERDRYEKKSHDKKRHRDY